MQGWVDLSYVKADQPGIEPRPVSRSAMPYRWATMQHSNANIIILSLELLNNIRYYMVMCRVIKVLFNISFPSNRKNTKLVQVFTRDAQTIIKVKFIRNHTNHHLHLHFIGCFSNKLKLADSPLLFFHYLFKNKTFEDKWHYFTGQMFFHHPTKSVKILKKLQIRPQSWKVTHGLHSFYIYHRAPEESSMAPFTLPRWPNIHM